VICRVWALPHRRGSSGHASARRSFFSVSSPQEARETIDRIRRRHRTAPLYTAMDEFGMECYTRDGWVEWHDLQGLDINGRPIAGEARDP